MKSVRFTVNRIVICNFFVIILAMMTFHPVNVCAGDDTDQSDKLLVFLSTGDKEVFTKTAFPYTFNAKKHGWFDEVRFLIWGPSAKLIAEDPELHESLNQLKQIGIQLQSCRWCAEQYGVDGKLKELGVEVIYMGQHLSDMLKSDWKILTF